MESQDHASVTTAARKEQRGIVTRSRESTRELEATVDDSLLRLMEELVESIEQREAGDPDAPAWEAQMRIQRLEEELARRVRSAPARGPFVVASPDEALAGIV
jgi:hypothetical protein